MTTTLTAASTVVCPSCGATDDTPSDIAEGEVSVTACTQCRANLVFVPRPASAVQPASGSESTARTLSRPAPHTARIALVVLCALAYLLLGVALYGASYGVKQLAPYKAAESFVAQHPVVAEEIGQPLGFGWFPTVHVQSRGRKGTAYVDISVSGPRTSGRVAAYLDVTGSDWRVREAQYQLTDEEIRPLWVQFPGDYALLKRLEALMDDLDQATTHRDVDALMRHIAPNAQFRFIVERPDGRGVRTYRTREDYRREILAGILMTRDVRRVRHSAEFQLAPDGHTATGIIEATEERETDGRRIAYHVQETMTYSFQGDTPLITSIDGVQQVKR